MDTATWKTRPKGQNCAEILSTCSVPIPTWKLISSRTHRKGAQEYFQWISLFWVCLRRFKKRTTPQGMDVAPLVAQTLALKQDFPSSLCTVEGTPTRGSHFPQATNQLDGKDTAWGFYFHPRYWHFQFVLCVCVYLWVGRFMHREDTS